MSDTRWRVLVVRKEDPSKPANSRKGLDITTVMYFVSKMNGYPLHVGDGFNMMLVPNRVETDVQWFQDNIFRNVDIQRATNDAECKRTADRLVNRARELDPDGTRYAGAFLVEAFVRQMYMQSEVWEPDALRFEVRLRAPDHPEAQRVPPRPHPLPLRAERERPLRPDGHTPPDAPGDA